MRRDVLRRFLSLITVGLVAPIARVQSLSVASRWDVVDTNGRWITTVDLPERFTTVEIGADYVAGLARDPEDVEQVRVYHLRKPDSLSAVRPRSRADCTIS